MTNEPQSDLTVRIEPQQSLSVRVEPHEMVQYVQMLMQAPHGTVASDLSLALAERQWSGDRSVAKAAQLRWSALNRAFGDSRVSTWTTNPKQDQIHVPAALIGAAGVAKLTLEDEEVVFDIPTLLDATLELCEPVGHG